MNSEILFLKEITSLIYQVLIYLVRRFLQQFCFSTCQSNSRILKSSSWLHRISKIFVLSSQNINISKIFEIINYFSTSPIPLNKHAPFDLLNVLSSSTRRLIGLKQTRVLLISMPEKTALFTRVIPLTETVRLFNKVLSDMKKLLKIACMMRAGYITLCTVWLHTILSYIHHSTVVQI